MAAQMSTGRGRPRTGYIRRRQTHSRPESAQSRCCTEGNKRHSRGRGGGFSFVMDEARHGVVLWIYWRSLLLARGSLGDGWVGWRGERGSANDQLGLALSAAEAAGPGTNSRRLFTNGTTGPIQAFARGPPSRSFQRRETTGTTAQRPVRSSRRQAAFLGGGRAGALGWLVGVIDGWERGERARNRNKEPCPTCSKNDNGEKSGLVRRRKNEWLGSPLPVNGARTQEGEEAERECEEKFAGTWFWSRSPHSDSSPCSKTRPTGGVMFSPNFALWGRACQWVRCRGIGLSAAMR